MDTDSNSLSQTVMEFRAAYDAFWEQFEIVDNRIVEKESRGKVWPDHRSDTREQQKSINIIWNENVNWWVPYRWPIRSH